MSGEPGGARIAVALHDVEPATFERCALIRDWLDDQGIGRATLLVIPAPDLHSFADRRPEMVEWLHERLEAGDAVAQHGLRHAQGCRARPGREWVARRQGAGTAEFAGMNADDARSTVEAGRAVLASAGIRPRGFVAPAYAYTRPLRRELPRLFHWWAGLLRTYRGGADRHGRPAGRLVPALTLGTSSRAKRASSPLAMRAGAALAGSVLRLDLHPADFDYPRHVLALEAVLRRARGRIPATYDELLAG